MEHPLKKELKGIVDGYLRGLCALEPHGDAEKSMLRDEKQDIVHVLRELALEYER